PTGSSSRSSSPTLRSSGRVDMTDPSVSTTRPPTVSTGPASSGAGSRRLRGAANYIALTPFLAYVGLFLIVPTLVVTFGALTTADGQFTFENVGRLFTDEVFIQAFVRSIQLAVATAIAGAILGAVLAWAVVRGDP